MPFYTRVFSALPLTFARSNPLMAEFDRIQAGFAAVEVGTVAEVTAARQGQGSLVLNMGRYVSTFSPAAGSVDLNSFRVRNAADGEADGDYVTVRQFNAQILAATLPTQAGQEGATIITDGATASWGNWWGAPTTLTVANNGLTLANRRTYYLDSSGGAFAVNLPASLSWVKFVDTKGQCSINNVTINSNGNGNFRDGDTTLVLDIAWDSVELVKTASGVREQ